MFKNPLFLAFLASILFGIWPIPFKLAILIGPKPDIIIWIGVGVVLAGCFWKFFNGGELNISVDLIKYCVMGGAIFTAGLILSMFALSSEGGYLALVAPIYNINTIWAMLAGLIYFGEYQKVSVPYAVAGAVLITIGGGLTGLAKK